MLHGPRAQVQAYEQYARDTRARVATGYHCIDNVLRGGGFAPGDVAMVLGRSEVGKSYFLQNLIGNMKNVPLLDISLEMTVEQKVQRMVCIEFGLDPREFEYGVKLASASSVRALDGFEERYPWLSVFKPQDVAGAGWDQFSRALEEYEREYGTPARVVTLDFLGLVKRDQYAGAENARIPRLAQEAERWADAMGVSLVLLHQTGRANEGSPTIRNHGHIPLTMEDAMYGGEQNADYMFGLYRPEREPPPGGMTSDDPEYKLWQLRVEEAKGKVFVQLLKNRHGPRTIESQYPGFSFRWEWPSGKMIEEAWNA